MAEERTNVNTEEERSRGFERQVRTLLVRVKAANAKIREARARVIMLEDDRAKGDAEIRRLGQRVNAARNRLNEESAAHARTRKALAMSRRMRAVLSKELLTARDKIDKHDCFAAGLL